MSFEVTIRSLSNQLDQLENLKPESPQVAENAINELQRIAEQLHEALRGLSETTPAHMIATQITLSKISELNDRFIKQNPATVAIDKLRELMISRGDS